MRAITHEELSTNKLDDPAGNSSHSVYRSLCTSACLLAAGAFGHCCLCTGIAALESRTEDHACRTAERTEQMVTQETYALAAQTHVHIAVSMSISAHSRAPHSRRVARHFPSSLAWKRRGSVYRDTHQTRAGFLCRNSSVEFVQGNFLSLCC